MNKKEQDKEREKALEALNILSAQIGNARLRKEWKSPIERFIKTFMSNKGKSGTPDDKSSS